MHLCALISFVKLLTSWRIVVRCDQSGYISLIPLSRQYKHNQSGTTMIGISRQTDYACRILLHLAMHEPDGRITARTIAEQRLIPQSVVRRIVAQLSVAGLVKTSRGNEGGMVLARPAAEISLLDVLQAMDGPVSLNACVEDRAGCPLMPVCSVHETWCAAHDVLIAELQRATFDKLAQRGKVLAQ
jgi:Rrf2 family protein